MSNELVKVWDLPVRVFHWLLVSCFIIDYVTEDDFMTLHVYAGYTIMGLVLFRLVWGIIGTKHARFSDFLTRPSVASAYLKSIAANSAQRYLGHNPAGAAMILALLASLLITCVTGLATYATEQSSGPLVEFMLTAPNFIYDAAEDMHEFFANATLVLVIFHVAGVVIASLSHKENLVLAMITGLKRAE